MAREGAEEWQDRYGSEPRKGSDILVQCLEREGVKTLFAYPGGASMEIHQALTRSPLIRNILCRHEQACLCATCREHGLLACWEQLPSALNVIETTASSHLFSIRTPDLMLDPLDQLCRSLPCVLTNHSQVGVREKWTWRQGLPSANVLRCVTCMHACPMSQPLPLVQGEVFAAEGYAKVTGEVGVCIATSGPGATNLVTGLADALLDSVPMVAITGQVMLLQPCFPNWHSIVPALLWWALLTGSLKPRSCG